MSKRARSSQLWSVFTIIDRIYKIARCTLCGQDLNFKSTITNLKKHLMRKHPDRLKIQAESLLDEGPDIKETQDSKGKSDYYYFELIHLI